MILHIAPRGRLLRSLLLVTCTLGVIASEARIERVLGDYRSGLDAAARERDQALAAANGTLRQAVDAQRARSVRDLQRLLRSGGPATEQILIHRALLQVDPDHAESRAFFAALGTLDQELATLEAPSVQMAATMTGVDILADTAALPPDELGRHALWLTRLDPADLQPEGLRDHSANAVHAQIHGELDFSGPSFADGIGLQIPEPGLPVGDEWVVAMVGTFPLAGDQQWRSLASHHWGQHHIVVDRKGRPGVFDDSTWAPADGGDLRKLSGRHCLIAVGAEGRTTFYLDGEPLGSSRAQVTSPMLHIGNHLSLDQAWCMPVESIAVFDRTLDPASVAALSARLLR